MLPAMKIGLLKSMEMTKAIYFYLLQKITLNVIDWHFAFQFFCFIFTLMKGCSFSSFLQWLFHNFLMIFKSYLFSVIVLFLIFYFFAFQLPIIWQKYFIFNFTFLLITIVLSKTRFKWRFYEVSVPIIRFWIDVEK